MNEFVVVVFNLLRGREAAKNDEIKQCENELFVPIWNEFRGGQSLETFCILKSAQESFSSHSLCSKAFSEKIVLD